ncbi:hypothetical protein C8Q73DRAFT_715761 [Cubamyces lactineus]|nr:hypothetical protein C8Q73DRAFT_715761 [Cubamyces lactineus]
MSAIAIQPTDAGSVYSDSDLNVPADSILLLNDDILDLIIRELVSESKATAFALSQTCRRIRSRCLPMFFKECSLSVLAWARSERFLPRTLWPYVCILRISEWTFEMPTPAADSRSEAIPSETRHSAQCSYDVYPTPYLEVVLAQMPRLRTLIFTAYQRSKPQRMIPWSSIQRTLSLRHPSLEGLVFDLHWLALELLRSEDFVLDEASLALRAFHYTPHKGWALVQQREPTPRPSEARAVELLVERNRPTLERLVLPMYTTPLDQMCSGPIWPNLRELRLRGEYRAVLDSAGFPIPYILAFANMPRLRVLELKLAQPEGLEPKPIWPAGYPAATSWPWPDLTELSVTCPRVDDQIYAHLPSTMRSLTLQYTPHYTDYVWMLAARGSLDGRWQWPLLTASEMLGILRQCRFSALRYLALEYLDDDDEEELLSYVAQAFPQLTSLEVLRCHRTVNVDDSEEWQDPCAFVERICRPIVSLHLRTLALHLDLAETPIPLSPAEFDAPYNDDQLGSFYNVLHQVADRVALIFRPELEEIKLWRPDDYYIYEWRCYEVVRSRDFGTYTR